MGDDFWVASRHRQLFVYALRYSNDQLNSPLLHQLCQWCDENIITLWSTLPRLMLYNASCLVRGRSPKEILIQQARDIYEAEKVFLEKMDTMLSTL
jgi:hypothetical protein